jgi:hypothetical protein
LGGPASVDRQRKAADLGRGLRAQEKRRRADLVRRRELERGLLLAEELALRRRLGSAFSARGAIVDLLLHERRQHPAGADRVAR